MCAFLGNSVLENIYFIVEGLCKNVIYAHAHLERRQKHLRTFQYGRGRAWQVVITTLF